MSFRNGLQKRSLKSLIKRYIQTQLRKFTGPHLLRGAYCALGIILLFCVLEKIGEVLRGFHSIISVYYTHVKWQSENQHLSKYLMAEKASTMVKFAVSLMGVC